MRLFAAIDLFFFFVIDVIRSTIRVASEVLTPGFQMQPAIIRVDVTGMSDRQLFFMMNMITMTPGSMGIGLSDDRSALYLHIMYLEGSLTEVRESFEQSYGKKVRRVF